MNNPAASGGEYVPKGFKSRFMEAVDSVESTHWTGSSKSNKSDKEERRC
jgi:hypothetical protein